MSDTEMLRLCAEIVRLRARVEDLEDHCGHMAGQCEWIIEHSQETIIRSAALAALDNWDKVKPYGQKTI
jgi:hypothetical protein